MHYEVDVGAYLLLTTVSAHIIKQVPTYQSCAYIILLSCTVVFPFTDGRVKS